MSTAELWRRVTLWGVLPAALAVLVGGLALGSAGAALLGGLLAFNAGIFLTVMTMTVRKDTRRLRELESGRELIARWRVDPQDWQEHGAGEWLRAKRLAGRRIWGWGGGLALTLAVASLREFDLLRVQLPLAVFGLGLGAAGALAVSAAALIRAWVYYRPPRGDLEVRIFGQGLAWRGNYYNWEPPQYLAAVTFQPGGDNDVLEFTIANRKHEVTPTTVRVPVARDHAAEAAAVPGRFGF